MLNDLFFLGSRHLKLITEYAREQAIKTQLERHWKPTNAVVVTPGISNMSTVPPPAQKSVKQKTSDGDCVMSCPSLRMRGHLSFLALQALPRLEATFSL